MIAGIASAAVKQCRRECREAPATLGLLSFPCHMSIHSKEKKRGASLASLSFFSENKVFPRNIH